MDGPSGEQPEKELSSIESLLKRISEFGVVIMGIIGGFWFTLPYNPDSDKYKGLINFTRFIVAIIVVLIVYLRRSSRDRQAEARFWGKVAVAGVVASIVAFFGYYMIFENWTVKHKEKVLVIGYQVKQDVQEFVDHHPDMLPRELLSYAAWNPWKIWTSESIRQVRILLALFYLICAPIFAITAVAVAKLMSSSLRRRE